MTSTERTDGKTKECAGCLYWCTMVAEGTRSLCGGNGPLSGEYTEAHHTCTAWRSGRYDAVDQPLADPFNDDRVRRVAAALVLLYGNAYAAGDLLADIMHFAECEGVDFREMLRDARIHFDAELKGEPW
jgi:hypothetical protein